MMALNKYETSLGTAPTGPPKINITNGGNNNAYAMPEVTTINSPPNMNYTQSGQASMPDYSSAPQGTRISSNYSWNPSQEQKNTIAADSYKMWNDHGQTNDWMNFGGSNPFEIRVTPGEGGRSNFNWRNAGDTGEGQFYGSLNANTWANQNNTQAMNNEANNFWGYGSNQFGDWWGKNYGLEKTGGNAVNPSPVPPASQPAPYTPPYPVVPGNAEDVTNYGLGAGQQLLDQGMQQDRIMPAWWGNDYQYQNPEEWGKKYPDQVFNPSLNFNNLPGEYQGLQNGDYDKLETALRQPGEIAAQNAYDTGIKNLKNMMGYSGLYGSSVMGQQANQGINREFINANAANAANATAQRYGLQQGDQQFGATYGLQRADLDRQNVLDQWKAGVTNAGLDRDYNNQRFMFDFANSDAARNEMNSLNKSRYDYLLQSDAWNQMNNENLFNQAMALAGRGTPLTTAAMNYQNQQNAADRNDNAAMWSLGTNLVGGLFGFGQDGGWDNSFINSLWSNIG